MGKQGAIKTILVSQPKPESAKSPYLDLAERYGLKIDFRPFIHVEGIEPKEFRQYRIQLSDHTAVIFTSRNAIDHFFRIATETRFTVPDTMKYFCTSEAVAYYLQKYVIYRKRKIFHGKQVFKDLIDTIKKHKEERFLLPCSDILRATITEQLDEIKVRYTKAMLYRTVCSDLSDLAEVNYDMLVFFSPSGIESLYKNFPNFKQNNTKIAAFGPTTHRAVENAGLTIDVKAPSPEFPSMTMAIADYVKNGS